MTNQEFVALVRKNPISFGCGLLAVLFAVGSYYRSDALPLATEELEKKTTEGQRLEANLKNAVQLKEQLDSLTMSGRAIDGRLIRGSELAKNLQYFYRLETAAGVKLIELRQNPVSKPTPGKPAGTFTNVSFVVTAQGDYRSLLDFLRRMESGAHFSRVTMASLSAATMERTGPLKLALNVELLGLP